MDELLVHPTSQTLIDNYLKQPAHGLLLSGSRGVGLFTIARTIAQQIDRDSYVEVITPDEKGTITIETVRGLYALTRSQRDTPLVVIIDDADAMGREAQNALLKLLEEPARNVFFVLTSHHPQQLLATITSRVQHITIATLPARTVDSLISSDVDQATRAQLLFIADGLPAEIIRLQSDPAYFERSTKYMRDARAFLAGDMYARLLLVKEYSADRATAIDFLESLSMIWSFMLFNQHSPAHALALEKIETISSRLQQNAHVRTQLTYLVTQL